MGWTNASSEENGTGQYPVWMTKKHRKRDFRRLFRKSVSIYHRDPLLGRSRDSFPFNRTKNKKRENGEDIEQGSSLAVVLLTKVIKTDRIKTFFFSWNVKRRIYCPWNVKRPFYLSISPPPPLPLPPSEKQEGFDQNKANSSLTSNCKTFRVCASRWTEVRRGIGSQRMNYVVLVICFISVECRKDKVFCVICEEGLKANKSQILSQFRTVCGPWARTCQSISIIFFRFDITFARKVYHLGIKMKTNMTIVLIRRGVGGGVRRVRTNPLWSSIMADWNTNDYNWQHQRGRFLKNRKLNTIILLPGALYSRVCSIIYLFSVKYCINSERKKK